jgi:AcrR family transcriptional regulator
MTQKVFFTREAIIEAAFEITRDKGWAAVSTRSIARKLGSSTMPIYSSMRSMEEIEAEVRSRAEALLLDYQRRPFSDQPAQNKAVGYVAFARDQKNLFRFLYVDRPVKDTSAEEGTRSMSLADLAEGEGAPGLAEQTRVAMQDPRILKSWIFTHGLASMISGGVLDLPDDRIKDLLLEAGAAFFMSEHQTAEARQQAVRGQGGLDE